MLSQISELECYLAKSAHLYLYRTDICLALPKVFGMIGDGFREHLGFSTIILSGGKTPDGKVSFYAYAIFYPFRLLITPALTHVFYQ
jgi:hypothetical protein